MATNETVQARVPKELKMQAEAVFSSMGLKTSDAIRLFLQQSVNSGGLPFQPKAKLPTMETKEAMRQARDKEGTHYDNVEDMFKQLDI